MNLCGTLNGTVSNLTLTLNQSGVAVSGTLGTGIFSGEVVGVVQATGVLVLNTTTFSVSAPPAGGTVTLFDWATTLVGSNTLSGGFALTFSANNLSGTTRAVAQIVNVSR
jgi:hypothetical protein